MMTPIEEIKHRLSKYPGVRYESDDASITVFPITADGFSVAFTESLSNGYTVYFEGWHEDFEDPAEALNIFALGLSDESRLREYRRGNTAYKWTLELLEDGEWIGQSTTGLVFFPFWRKLETRYLQNRLLSRK